MSRNKKKAWAQHDLEDWGSYMAAKKGKLEDQFQEAAQNEFQHATSLFSGVAIFVNGYTNPCADELKRLMMAHGGVYHHYMRSKITTHIIASNLPYSKIVAYRKSQNPLPLCKPEWIMDSIKAKKLLDWRPYILYSNCTETQPQLQFPGKSGNSLPVATTSCINAKSVSEGQKEIVKDVVSSDVSKKTSSEISSSEASSSKPTGGPLCTKNSEFLSEFYNNSRLHHISTMGATFKDYVNELRTKNDGTFPGLERLKALPRTARSYRGVQNESDSEDDLFESRPVEPEAVGTDPVIMHIDMDCFFVSVGLRNRPELKGLPVAVTHAKGNKQPSKSIGETDGIEEDYGSFSEVASCSYEARKAGVKNGMFLGQALKLCPNIKTIQYDFEGYKEVSYILYNTVASYTLNIEAVSCDEMYADVTSVLRQSQLSPLEFASSIREEIKIKTGCPVSTGFGSNKLQARLATRKAKPDGQFHLESTKVQDYIGSMVVRDLPGVGYTTMQMLNKMNVNTCAELQKVTLGLLQREFGRKTGEMLHNMCRGIDNSKLTVEHVRKSVSAEVNYGIRFENGNDADEFLRKLSQEVCSRLQKANAKGRSVTLKLMVRAKDAPKEAIKFMGHGICDNFTKSKNLIAPTDDPVIITREVLSLWNQMQQLPEDIRGIGIQISRLESLKTRSGNANLMNFISKAVPKVSEQVNSETVKTVLQTSNQVSVKATIHSDQPAAINSGRNVEVAPTKPRGLKAFFAPKEQLNPHNSIKNDNKGSSSDIGDIDESVLAELPEDIRNEILKSRNDRRASTIADPRPSTSTAVHGVANENCVVPSRQNPKEKESVPRVDEVEPLQDIDESVFNELPEDIRNEILKSKPNAKVSSKSRQPQQEMYFKHTKSTSGKCSKVKMPPIEQIDMAVLIELPEDIRNEIINEYKANKQAREQGNNSQHVESVQNKERISAEQTRKDVFNKDNGNVSFSQVDPEFLAALSEDMKNDVEMYCMVKKKEKQLKLKTTDGAAFKLPAKNKNAAKQCKKGVRLPKPKKKATTDGKRNSGEKRKVENSPEGAQRIDGSSNEGRNLANNNNSTGGRFLESELNVNQEETASLKRREEIISHHTSFTGTQAKTDEHREMLTSLVNYLFTLPVSQVKMQIQTWISNSDDVNEIDLLSLATFLSMLPKKKRLEDLHILLKTMHRCITKTGSCDWHETYRKTVDHVQRYMQIEYNSNLMLPRIKCDLCKDKSDH